MKMNYQKVYQAILEYQKEQHRKNQKKILWGIRLVILIPLVFLTLMFSRESSKVVFLVLWIVSLFTISAYLIYVEYMDYTLQERMAELGMKEDGQIESLLDETALTRYFRESELPVGELLLEEKEQEEAEPKKKKNKKKKSEKKAKKEKSKTEQKSESKKKQKKDKKKDREEQE